ncbi:MAG: hypothetical protein RL410_80 [Actinomycetota bacterium]|jgi:hypothetical protein
MSSGIDELESLAKNPGKRAEVLAELNFRNTKRARELKAKLGGNKTPTSRQSTKKPSNHERRTNPVPEKTFEDQFEARYESLRQTFTAEGELLAKWGMTPLMPKEMRILVLDTWQRMLSDDADEFGRSTRALEEMRAIHNNGDTSND